MPGHTKTEKQEIEQVEFTKQTSGEEMQSTEVSNVNFKKSQKQTSRSPENKLLGSQASQMFFLPKFFWCRLWLFC